ncbi:MAG: ATP-binding protein, partial [Longimicrobiales bacterium]
AAPLVERALEVMPVVGLTGARQTGKSTLAGALASGETWRYTTLDVPAVLGLARRDPVAFVQQSPALVIDEVQRAPDLLLAVKAAVDADRPRVPGRFLLTGSANLLLLKQVRESLAGRASYVTLHPLTRREQLGFGEAGIWDELLASEPGKWRDLVLAQAAPMEDWRDVVRRGGYPTAAHEIEDDEARAIWFDGYLRTYLQRDVPELSAIENVPAFDSILRSVALRVGTMVNQTQLAREASVPQSTVNRYIAILEASYQINRLPAFTLSRTKQLVKSPKYYWSDVGFALFLARQQEPQGAHLESLVAQDLFAWRGAHVAPPDVFYWRTSKGYEVDFVIGAGARVIPIEVKTTVHPSTQDIVSLSVFLEEYADRATAGLLLHAGDQTYWIARNILAAPWWRVI